MPLMSPELTQEAYRGVLVRLLPVLRGWERWAAGEAPDAVRGLLPARRRSHLLERDLAFLGAPAPGPGPLNEREPVDWEAVVRGPAVADGHALTPEAFAAAFLGAMYVVEGSTLGGRFIAGHVEVALGLEPGAGDAYFRGHGEATGALWRELKSILAAVPEKHAPQLIAAAKRTFRAFGEALTAEVPSAGDRN